jgi:hypothetical protein
MTFENWISSEGKLGDVFEICAAVLWFQDRGDILMHMIYDMRRIDCQWFEKTETKYFKGKYEEMHHRALNLKVEAGPQGEAGRPNLVDIPAAGRDSYENVPVNLSQEAARLRDLQEAAEIPLNDEQLARLIKMSQQRPRKSIGGGFQPEANRRESFAELAARVGDYSKPGTLRIDVSKEERGPWEWSKGRSPRDSDSESRSSSMDSGSRQTEAVRDAPSSTMVSGSRQTEAVRGVPSPDEETMAGAGSSTDPAGIREPKREKGIEDAGAAGREFMRFEDEPSLQNEMGTV